MEFRILGPLEVEDEGRTIPLAGAKQRSLLALLLLARGRAVSTDRLIDEIWDGAPPETALKNVQVYVSQLRTALGDGRLVRRERGYELRVASGELDADRFDEIVRSTSGVEPEVAAARLQEALALFRGDPLSDLSLEPWAQPEIALLEERRLVALEARINAEPSRSDVTASSCPSSTHSSRHSRSASISWSSSCSPSIAPGDRPRLLTHTAAGRPGCGKSSASTRAAGCRSSSSASCARIQCSTRRQRRLLAVRHTGGAGRSFWRAQALS